MCKGDIIMKRKGMTFILAVALCLLTFAGCASDTKTEPTHEPTVQTSAIPKVEQIDYNKIYKSTLDEYYNVIKKPDAYDDLEEGKMGVIENAQYLEDAALNEIGYLIRDINNDEVPELLIGVSNEYAGNDIYALFTVKDLKPHYVLEGRSRSSYALINGGKLYYCGSNGAAYRIFGEYELDKNGELKCIDFYFSYERSNNYDDIGFFHNNTGVYERSAAEEMNITEDEFRATQEDLADRTVKLEFIPFAKHTLSAQTAPTTEPTKAPMPEFTNSWVGMSYTSDGSAWKLFVDILSDGTASYKCGPPESEIMVDYNGSWIFDPTYENITFNLKDRIEGDSFNGVFKVSVDGTKLSLKHLSGNTFLYGTEERTFDFVLK